ncbi:MAG: membrane dipeptidase [Rhodothermales bacterium]|nr:membrane dipeptidase [Rhodothermales bacterium]
MRLLTVLFASSLLLVGCTSSTSDPASDASMEDLARGIHERAITLDTHDDINVRNFTEEANYTMDLPTQVNIPKMNAGGLDVAWLVVYTGQGELTDEGYAAAYENAVSKFEAIHWLAEEKAPDQIEIAYTSDDVRRIVGEGKKVAMIGVENAYPVGLDLDNIRQFQEWGARYMSLSHNGHSQFSDSNTGERDDVWLHDGLSDLGRQAIAEMNRWGIMVDLSHPSKKANMETMALSRAPVMASHSSARALNDVSRNLDDEELMALKENGGVVQTVAFRSYVDADKHSAWQEAVNDLRTSIAQSMDIELVASRRDLFTMSPEAREAYRERVRPVEEALEARMDEIEAGPVDVADFVDHIDYLVELIGLDHVGISSDFDGGGGVEGWMDASETFNVTMELVRRGYTEDQIAQLWSGNLLRVLDEVQQVAAQIQAEAS